MNTAVRVLGRGRLQSTIPPLKVVKPKFNALLLSGIVLLSAFVVIYLKDVNRRLFIQYQSLQATHENLYAEWEKLLLEQSTWSAQARVQKVAKYRLGMDIPAKNEILMVKD